MGTKTQKTGSYRQFAKQRKRVVRQNARSVKKERKTNAGKKKK